ncbi:MAG: hypothetical protein JO291_01580 [Acidimicrobiia bacterium]|nr:hypothetical protein [Acidimicrobiia bacterium]
MTSQPVWRATGILGWIAVVLITVGAVIVLVPVRNPGVQQCGAPLTFLVSGQLDRLPDATGRVLIDNRVVTLSPAARHRAVDSPCSERVERRAIPAGVLVVLGSVMGLTAVAIGTVGAWRRASARITAEHQEDRPEVQTT